MCAQIIEQFQQCHLDHPIAKFFGECTDLKIKLDRCFRQEKALKRKENFEQSKKLKERLHALRKETTECTEDEADWSPEQFPSGHRLGMVTFNGTLQTSLRVYKNLLRLRTKGKSQICDYFSQTTASVVSNQFTTSPSSLRANICIEDDGNWCFHLDLEVSVRHGVHYFVLAELLDAWLWMIVAKLRPHLAPGELELLLKVDLVEQILAHRLWLGCIIDRFKVMSTIDSTSSIPFQEDV
ncbi:Cytochrome c oxidase biogenesis protein Cmc1-like [Parasponia andersonii]|uniref:COX assembly mitochondrial protein 2 homolog n=1 Tax=Parasponia andersonii TaxID=3476 RepID=A0A2P5CLE4_PARAD|nr:Cytochrome c oxidase biogenesis protein Cmc1-like [Parasponia andersonii]